MKAWIKSHKRLIALKVVIASMLIVTHFYPQSMPGLLVNLAWLFLF